MLFISTQHLSKTGAKVVNIGQKKAVRHKERISNLTYFICHAKKYRYKYRKYIDLNQKNAHNNVQLFSAFIN